MREGMDCARFNDFAARGEGQTEVFARESEGHERMAELLGRPGSRGIVARGPVDLIRRGGIQYGPARTAVGWAIAAMDVLLELHTRLVTADHDAIPAGVDL